MKVLTCVLVLFMFLSNCVPAFSAPTPDTAIHRRVIFIGRNKINYFIYLIEHDNNDGTGGNYYVRNDAIFLCKYDIKTAKLLEKILLREVNHIDKSTFYRDWVSTDKIKSKINGNAHSLVES